MAPAVEYKELIPILDGRFDKSVVEFRERFDVQSKIFGQD
jgi:hypothetical protein